MQFFQTYGGILAPILYLAVTIVVPLIGAAAVRAVQKFGLDVEARHREALQSALRHAAMLAIEKATGVEPKTPAQAATTAAREAVKTTVQGAAQNVIRNVVPNTHAAVDYVQKSVPDAIEKFKLDTGRIRDLLAPHIADEMKKVKN